jgi:hypothetical protein
MILQAEMREGNCSITKTPFDTLNASFSANIHARREECASPISKAVLNR